MSHLIFENEYLYLNAHNKLNMTFDTNPLYPVETSWHIDYIISIWFFQQIDIQIQFINYIQLTNTLIEDVIKIIHDSQIFPDYIYDFSKIRPTKFFKPTKSHYERHYTGESLDNFEYPSKSTIRSKALSSKTPFMFVPEGSKVNDIESIRTLLYRSSFHRNCEFGVEAWEHYAHEEQEWTLPAVNALRHVAVGIRRHTKSKPQYPPWSYQGIVDEYERHLRTGKPMRSYVIPS